MRTLFFTSALLFPGILLAQGSGLLPCGGPECNFGHLVKLGNNLIDFAIKLIPFLAAIAFSYAGFLYITAAGDEGKIKQAHGIFMNVVWGIVIALSAWLIVKAILVGLDTKSGFNLLK